MGRAYEVRKAAMQKTSAVKSKLYARFGKEIYIAAKNGEPDPELNINLKRIIEKAKSQQVPTEIINRAISKVKNKVIENYTTALYEGFGPGESSMLIECLSDNLNRTISDIKTCFNKFHGKLVGSGSVSFNYKNVSVVTIKEKKEEEIADILFKGEIDFIDIEEDDLYVSVYGEVNNLYKIKKFLEDALIDDSLIVEYEIIWKSEKLIKLNNEDEDNFIKLLNMLEKVDDVEKIYHNVLIEDF